MGASDRFTGVALNQSIAGKAFTQGAISWAVKTWLAGNGSNGVKVTQVDPYQGVGNYNALDTDVGQRIYFIPSAGRSTTAPILQLSIDGNSALDEYPPSAAPRVSVGAYGALIMRDMATNAEVEQSGPAAALTDGAQYCLELKRGVANNGRDYVGTLYAASGLTTGNPVVGAQIATKSITLTTAVSSTARRVHLSLPSANGPYVTIYGVDSVDAGSSSGASVTLVASNCTQTNNCGTGAVTINAAPAATVTSAVFRGFDGLPKASLTVENVVLMKLDRTPVLSLANQVTNGTGRLVIASASLTAGTSYMLASWNADGSFAGNKKVTAV